MYKISKIVTVGWCGPDLTSDQITEGRDVRSAVVLILLTVNS